MSTEYETTVHVERHCSTSSVAKRDDCPFCLGLYVGDLEPLERVNADLLAALELIGHTLETDMSNLTPAQVLAEVRAIFTAKARAAIAQAKGEPACCESLAGWALAWHRYSAHGGPYPLRPRKARAAIEAAEKGDA
mgnify:FL=1